MTTDKGEGPPDSPEIELDEADLNEGAQPRPETLHRPAPSRDELPAGVPPPRRLSKRQLLWGAVPVSVLLLCGALKLFTVLNDRERVERRCVDYLGAASAHLARGDFDLAEDSMHLASGECAEAHSADLADIRRKLTAAQAELKAKADRETQKAAATREREAVASFPSESTSLRKDLAQATLYLARNDFEKAAPLVAPCFITLAPFKNTSIESTADWIALDTQCEQLSQKMKPFQDRLQAELAAAGQKVLAEAAQDRRDGVKYTRGDHIAALTMEKLVLARRYAAANDEKGFALLIQNDAEIIWLKPLLKVNVIDHGGPGQPFVQIHFRGTTTDMWTTADALQDP